MPDQATAPHERDQVPGVGSVTEAEEPELEVGEGTVAGQQPDSVSAGQLGETMRTEGRADREPDAAESVNVLLFREGVQVVNVTLAETPDLVGDEENFVWIHLLDYSEESLRSLADDLGLHPAGVRIAVSGWQRPRLSVFPDHFFVAVTVPRVDPDRYRVLAGELDLFIGRNYLVSACKNPLPFIEKVLTRARTNPDLLRQDSAYLLYVVLDELLEHYEGLATGLDDQIEEMEERALQDESDVFLDDLLRLKRYVFALARLTAQHQEILAAFLRPDMAFVDREEMEPYFRDLQERLARLLDQFTTAKDAINGSFDLFVSHVSHRTNQVMKVLTMVSTVLLPASVILGFFGTSFEQPRFNTAAGFAFMMASIVVLSVILLVLFKRLGWMAISGPRPTAESWRIRGSNGEAQADQTPATRGGKPIRRSALNGREAAD